MKLFSSSNFPENAGIFWEAEFPLLITSGPWGLL
jgi:hypothetical protein